MTINTFKVTIHMVSGLDGFIAKKDNSVSWFETSDYYEKGVLRNKKVTATVGQDYYNHRNWPNDFRY